jgi:hypothetical protein
VRAAKEIAVFREETPRVAFHLLRSELLSAKRAFL